MTAPLNRHLFAQVEKAFTRYRDASTNQMNLMDVGAVLDLWFGIVDVVAGSRDCISRLKTHLQTS